jgi:hypothetical protein
VLEGGRTGSDKLQHDDASGSLQERFLKLGHCRTLCHGVFIAGGSVGADTEAPAGMERDGEGKAHGCGGKNDLPHQLAAGVAEDGVPEAVEGVVALCAITATSKLPPLALYRYPVTTEWPKITNVYRAKG